MLTTKAKTRGLDLPQAILIAEDNMLIAMETEELLLEKGCKKVTTVGNVADGLAALEAENFEFALLDVNLGIETSAEIAVRLRELGVPFALSTGFGENIADRTPYGDAPILTKPYANEDLFAVLGNASA